MAGGGEEEGKNDLLTCADGFAAGKNEIIKIIMHQTISLTNASRLAQSLPICY